MTTYGNTRCLAIRMVVGAGFPIRYAVLRTSDGTIIFPFLLLFALSLLIISPEQ